MAIPGMYLPGNIPWHSGQPTFPQCTAVSSHYLTNQNGTVASSDGHGEDLRLSKPSANSPMMNLVNN